MTFPECWMIFLQKTEVEITPFFVLPVCIIKNPKLNNLSNKWKQYV